VATFRHRVEEQATSRPHINRTRRPRRSSRRRGPSISPDDLPARRISRSAVLIQQALGCSPSDGSSCGSLGERRLVGRDEFCETEIAKLENERPTLTASRDEDVSVMKQKGWGDQYGKNGGKIGKEGGSGPGSQVSMADSQGVKVAETFAHPSKSV
jgi:hypothetical protein